MWGEIKGSGNVPYRTQIDLNQTAFKCSCPSRKFPCKHGLGLLLLSARNPTLLTQSDQEPDWVKEWMDKRSENTTKQPALPVAPVDTTDAKKADKLAKDREKRQTERLLKVQGGVAELERWLKDLIRVGLLSAPEKSPAFWEKTAARMVDAQAPGLGNRVKELGNIQYRSGNGWQTTILEQVSASYLLLEAFKRRDSLPPLLREDVRSLIGWNKSGNELLESPDTETVKDVWLVLARQTQVQDDLRIERQWLYGSQARRYALVLNFAYKNMPVGSLFTPATSVEAQLVFYPSRYPLRAVVKHQGSLGKVETQPALLEHWEAAQDECAKIVASLPWADAIPLSVASLTPTRQASRWLLRDGQGYYLPIAAEVEELKTLQLLAYSGGTPLDLFLLRSQDWVVPLGLWSAGEYRAL